MKNRTWDKTPNGKLFCMHNWKVCESVGVNWDIVCGITILCECQKCSKLKFRSNSSIKEVPDNLINKGIEYL
jgi:hypothetical protein